MFRHFSSGEEAAFESCDVGEYFGSLDMKQWKLGVFLLLRFSDIKEIMYGGVDWI
jgi:hypothetical protein